ncbi:hypothetical protein, partial [Plasmodium yoelii yoelii]
EIKYAYNVDPSYFKKIYNRNIY